MAAGLQIIGTHGVVQIDETYRNLSLRAKAAVTGNIQFTSGTSPILAYSTTDTGGAMTQYVGVSGSTYTWAYRQVPNNATYYIFDVPLAASGAAGTNVGFQVLNASSQVVFDTNNDYMKIIGVYTLNFPGTAYTGVQQPTGKTYAFTHVDTGAWHQDNSTGQTDIGGFTAYVDANGYFNTQYSISLGQRSGSSTPSGKINDSYPIIMVFDVTGAVASGSAGAGPSVTMAPGNETATSAASATATFGNETVTVTNGTSPTYLWTIFTSSNGTFAIANSTSATCTPSVSAVPNGTTATATLRCTTTIAGTNYVNDATLSYQNTTAATVTVTMSPGNETATAAASASATFGTETISVTGGTATQYQWTYTATSGGTFAPASGTSSTFTPTVSAVANGATATATLQCVTTVGGTNYTNTASLSYQNTTAGSFTPVLRTYTTGTSVTETAPAGASNVVIEVWGGGGGGGKGAGSIPLCTAVQGYAGGSSGYSRSSYAISGGQTLAYTVGTAGAGGTGPSAPGGNGTASTVSSGTKTITTITVNGGNGSTGTSTPGAGGTASGGNAVNTTGSTDTFGNGTTSYPPSGVNANTGATPANGDGGAGGASSASNGHVGTVGLIAFYYT